MQFLDVVRVVLLVNLSTSNFILGRSEPGPDPALWKIDDDSQNYISLNGISQNIHKLDYSKSRWSDDKQFHYCHLTIFETKLINGKKIESKFFMYSESTGFLFCVPSMIFGGITKLATTGFDDWKHTHSVLKQHENTPEHRSCIITTTLRFSNLGRVGIDCCYYSWMMKRNTGETFCIVLQL